MFLNLLVSELKIWYSVEYTNFGIYKTKDMKTIKIKDTKSAETVKKEVEQMIDHQGYVVSGKEEAERFFARFGATGYVYSDEDRKFTVKGEVKEGRQTNYTVVIIAYFIEVASDDCVYSVSVTED